MHAQAIDVKPEENVETKKEPPPEKKDDAKADSKPSTDDVPPELNNV